MIILYLYEEDVSMILYKCVTDMCTMNMPYICNCIYTFSYIYNTSKKNSMKYYNIMILIMIKS